MRTDHNNETTSDFLLIRKLHDRYCKVDFLQVRLRRISGRIFATTRMDLEDIVSFSVMWRMLSQDSHTEKDRCCMISLIYGT